MLIDFGTHNLTDPASGQTMQSHVVHDVTAEKLIITASFMGQTWSQSCPRLAGQPYDVCALIHAGAPCGSGAKVYIDPNGRDIVEDVSGTIIGVFAP